MFEIIIRIYHHEKLALARARGPIRHFLNTIIKFFRRSGRGGSLRFLTNCRLLPIFILTLGFSPTPAFSQTPCETIDAILQTVSTVRDFEIDAGKARTLETLSVLERQLDRLSLVSLFPSLDKNVFLLEQKEILAYLSKIQTAVTAGENNFSPDVRGYTEEVITPEFISTLSSLNSYWGCNFVQSQSDQTVSLHQNYSSKFGLDPVKTEDRLGGVYSPIPKMLNGPKRGEGHASVSHVTLNPLLLEGGKGVLLLMTFIVVSSASTYLYFKYQALQSVREMRHLLYLPVISKINNVTHPMVLVDISMNGGKLQHDQAIEGKPHISFFVGKRWLKGQVRWSNSSYAGVLFKSPLDAHVLMDVVQKEN